MPDNSEYIESLFNTIPMQVYLLLSVLAVLVCGIAIYASGLAKGIRITSNLLLAFYTVIVLGTTVVFRHDEGGNGIQLIPFRSYFIQDVYPRLFIENIMNVVAFIPIGAFLTIGRSKLKWWHIAIVGFYFSITIELLQLVFDRGMCEIDDVIHNIFGSIIGYYLIKLTRILYSKQNWFFKEKIIVRGICVLLLNTLGNINNVTYAAYNNALSSVCQGETIEHRIVLEAKSPLKQGTMVKNATYVINCDVQLAENITIPEGCILEFDGGTLQGKCTIIGNKTIIKADIVNIISPEITIKGTWIVAEAYPEWFGAKGDGIFDDAKAVNKCISLNSEEVNIPIKIIFTGSKYYVGEIINFSGRNHISFEGTNKNIIQKFGGNRNNMFDGGRSKHVCISNLTLDGSLDNWEVKIPSKPNWSQRTFNACIISASNTTDITVDNCVIKNFYYGIFLGGASEQNRVIDNQNTTDHITVTNCIFEHNKMSCIDTYNRYGLYISNNFFIDNGNIAVHIEPTIISKLALSYDTSDIFTAKFPVDGVNICNNVFTWTENPAIGIKLYSGVYAVNVSNNHFINGSAAIHSDGTKMFIFSNNTVKNGIGIRLYGNMGTGSIYGNTLLNVTSGISCYNDATTMGGVDIHDNIIVLKDELTTLPDYFRVQNSKYHDNIIRGYFKNENRQLKGVLNIAGASNSEIYNNKLLKCSDTSIPFFVVPITNQKELSAFIKKGVRIYKNIYEQKLEYEFSTDVAQTRPANPYIGQFFYDLNLNKVLVFIGHNWVDTLGNIVE